MLELDFTNGIIDARRSNASQYGFNLGCLEGVDATQLQDVPVSNGINHIADRALATNKE